jgi:hypothetical protein
MSKRNLPWEVLQRVEEICQNIRVANDFYTDLGLNVSLENPPVESEDLADLVITGRPLTAIQTGDEYRNTRIEIVLEARIPASRDDAQKLAWEAHADLMASIPKRSTTMPLGAFDPQFVSSDKLDPIPAQPFIVVQVVFSVGLSHKL